MHAYIVNNSCNPKFESKFSKFNNNFSIVLSGDATMRAQYCHIHAAYFSSHLVVPLPRFPAFAPRGSHLDYIFAPKLVQEHPD